MTMTNNNMPYVYFDIQANQAMNFNPSLFGTGAQEKNATFDTE